MKSSGGTALSALLLAIHRSLLMAFSRPLVAFCDFLEFAKLSEFSLGTDDLLGFTRRSESSGFTGISGAVQ